MNIFQAIILGIIEGITEFLPVSSTGHLIIAQKVLGLQTVNEFFTVVIQFGAILASVYFFREKITKILKSFVTLKNKKFKLKGANRDELLGVWILISIVPTLIIGYLFRHQIDSLQQSISAVAVATIVFGIVFYVIERISLKSVKPKLDIAHVTFLNVFIMGIFQAIAVIPGVSRSGSTISGGVAQNVKIKDAIEISFILGIPVIFAATLYKLVDTIKLISGDMIINTLIGTVVAFIVGLYSIKLTLGILSKNGFYPFMIYRVILGVLILFLLAVGTFG